MDRTILHRGQIFFLLALYYWGATGLGVGGRDGPFVCLALGGAAALLTLALPALCGREPRALLGTKRKGLSTALALLLALCGITASGDALRALPQLLEAMGQKTLPRPASLLLLLPLMWWMCILGIDALGRAAWLCILPVAALAVLPLLLSLGEGSLRAALPLLEHGASGLLAGAKAPALRALLPLPLCLLALAPHTEPTGRRPALLAAGVVFLLAALTALRDVAVLGGALSALLPYPSYTAGASLGHGAARWAGMLAAVGWGLALPFCAVLPLRLSLRVLNGLWPRHVNLWPPLLALLAGAAALLLP